MIVFNQLKKPLKGRKRETDSERVGGGVMPAGTEPDNMGPRGPRRKATSSRGRNARVRSLTVLAVDEWVRQRCRVNAGWYRRIQDFVPAAVKLSGFLFPDDLTKCHSLFRRRKRAKNFENTSRVARRAVIEIETRKVFYSQATTDSRGNAAQKRMQG